MVKGLLLTVLIIMLLLGVAWADVPPVISYQGKLANSSGASVADGVYTLAFAIYSSDSSVKAIWGPQTYDVEVRNGLFNVSIGEGNPLSADVFRREAWIEVRVRDQLVTPRTRIHCVGYAFRASEADAAASLKLPYSGSVSSIYDTLYLINAGGGRAARFETSLNTATSPTLETATASLADSGCFSITNSSNSRAAVHGFTVGTGNAILAETVGSGNAIAGKSMGSSGSSGSFVTLSSLNLSPTIQADTAGVGSAGYFTISNPSNSSAALEAFTDGAGAAVKGKTSGTGWAGYFEVNNSSAKSSGLQVFSNSLGAALQATAVGNGPAASIDISNNTSTATALKVNTYALGVGAAFYNGNAGNSQPTVSIINAGRGRALDVFSSGQGSTLAAFATGDGEAGYFDLNNWASERSALEVSSNGRASTIKAVSTRGGEAGRFVTTDGGNTNPAVYAETNGYGPAGRFHSNTSNMSVPAIRATRNGPGLVAKLEGDVEISGKVTGKAGSFLPVAFGTVYNNGVKCSGTPNFMSRWDGDNHRYVITLQDSRVPLGASATVIVTPLYGSSPSPNALMASNNDILVAFDGQQAYFSFVVYYYGG